MRKKSQKNKNTPLSKAVKETHAQPSIYLNKETMPQVEQESPLLSELTNEFFTKQRPDSWQYYYRSFTLKNADNEVAGLNTPAGGVLLDLDEIPNGQALVINYFKVCFGYKANALESGQRIPPFAPPAPLPGSQKYTFFEDNALIDLNFCFNLQSSQSVLADVNGVYDAQYIPGDTFNKPATATALDPRDGAFAGYRTLNQNVLENGESSTSLYIFEPSTLLFRYILNPSYPNKLYEYMDLTTVPTLLKHVQPTLFIEVRGHLLNRLDGQLLQSLVQPKHIVPKGIVGSGNLFNAKKRRT